MAARQRILTTGPKDGLQAVPSIEQAEGASQTYKKGAVVIATNGLIVEAGADPTAIVGVALQDGKNVAAGGVAHICPALPHMVFEMTIDDNTGTYALVAADKFKLYGIAKDAGGLWYVDQTDTSNTRVVIVGFKDPIGTQAARVYVKFRGSQTVYN